MQKRMRCGFLAAICLMFSLPVFCGSVPQREIALTFDDEIRPAIFLGVGGLAETLEVNQARATFFVLGYQVRATPNIFRSLAARGHEIENHTWAHDDIVKLEKRRGLDAVRATIARTSMAIAAATGRRPTFFRPPYWSMNRGLKDAIGAQGYRVMTVGDPDINSLDYDDFAHHRPASVLLARLKEFIRAREAKGIYRHVLVFHELPQTRDALRELLPKLRQEGYRFVTLSEWYGERQAASLKGIAYVTGTKAMPVRRAQVPVRALYLGVDNLANERKIAALEHIVATTTANAVIVDYKVDRPVPDELMQKLVARFRKYDAYLIARVVVMQDSYLAKKDPALAIRRRDGTLWWSGSEKWHRYWVDPASPEVLRYNIAVAKRAIDLGFDEINFDYIRFPTDGAMGNIVYPVFTAAMRKSEVMNHFFRELTESLRDYDPQVKLSVDLFGEVAVSSTEKGIGQDLLGAAEYFDVLCPMAYPSHYRCGEFGLHDPTAHPYEVYRRTLEPAIKFLYEHGSRATIRPWIQAFSIRSIYGCGPSITYGASEIRSEIRAGTELGVTSFMLWNAGSSYDARVFDRK
jgi:peptidoglycan/xylan/chitin deacetylase (PgdA/CDA1 family)